MNITPTGTGNYHDTNLSNSVPLVDENQEVITAMNAFLDYDSEDEEAMYAILTL